ncbi:hypothetical protein [Alloactinosynnema sp. L-07]|uniref:hypothetical protein n=1 Tax=Alloactinosynnema sp. L-07 TaxID=1653480 RepID=UPI00065EFC4E|nr:hypothetical protein [Alloactinosynnema sp. L-07]CRK57720.1 hypothetical protein [Alloactinosynnema sp. L-07]
MRTGNLVNIVSAVAVAMAGLIVTTGTAAATDVGGDGNPANVCPNGYTVASAPILRNGQTIGLVEMRWSWTCGGNWTRTTSYIGARQLQSMIDTNPWDGRETWADDYATQNWSPFRRVAPSQGMCSNGFIEDGGALYHASICA